MTRESELVELRTRADHALLAKLEKLKEYYGITENSEILRLLISEMHRRVIKKDDEIETIKQEFWAEIRRLEQLLRSRKK